MHFDIFFNFIQQAQTIEREMAKNGEPDYDQLGEEGECKVKIICLGDSAVGKSK